MREQRKYSSELKREVVKMVNEQGLTQSAVGVRLSIPSGTIAKWIAISKTEGRPANQGDRSVAEMSTEITRLRKELETARLEREILKKATVYFAKESLTSTRS